MQDAATSDFPAMAPADFDPAFQAVAVFVMCAQEEGLADLSLFHPALQFLDAKEVTIGKPDLMDEPACLRNAGHLRGFSDCQRERLFAKDMLAMTESKQGMAAVRVIGRADRDGVQLLAGAKLGRIDGYRRDSKPRGQGLGSRPFPAADHHHFRPRMAQKAGDVASLGKGARSYDAKSQFAATAHGKAVDRQTHMSWASGIAWSLAAGRIAAKIRWLEERFDHVRSRDDWPWPHRSPRQSATSMQQGQTLAP
jgi:hypothetical protein